MPDINTPNVLGEIAPKILASALDILNEELPLLKAVNTNFQSEAAKKGDVIWVPYSNAIKARDVVPGAYFTLADPIKANAFPIPLNHWKEAPFELDDKEIRSIMDGFIPLQVMEAARAIRNELSMAVWSCYKRFNQTVGTPGEELFIADDIYNKTGLRTAADARRILNEAKAPQNGRMMALDTQAESNASILPAFSNVYQSGDSQVIAAGTIGRKLNFDWSYDHTAPYHQAGNLSPKSGWTVSGATQTVNVENPFMPHSANNMKYLQVFSGTGANTATKVVAGDLFKVAGDDTYYVVLNDASPTSATSLTVEFSPKPKVQWSQGAQVTWIPSHQVSLAFQKDAIGLVIAPFVGTEQLNRELNRFVETMIDPVTGIPLRLEIAYGSKLFQWNLDTLYGVAPIRDEFAIRVIS